jgi:hypothetical protein
MCHPEERSDEGSASASLVEWTQQQIPRYARDDTGVLRVVGDAVLDTARPR